MGDSRIAAQNGSLGLASRGRGAVRDTKKLRFHGDVTAPATNPAKLVVAFDIGTIYSGISYCIQEPGTVLETPAVTSHVKVPSLLYYDKSGNVSAAGFEALSESTEDALKKGWTKAEWWKLHLCPKHLASSIDPENDLPPLPSGKSAVAVLTDFIEYLSNYAKSCMGHHATFVWPAVENSIEYIFTYPNGWEGVQQRYRQAIEDAGLIPSATHWRSRVHILTEAEARLHFYITKFRSAEIADQAAPQGIVIINAGDVTIDSNVLSVTSNPVYCEEVAPAECRLQGSVFVARRAKALLQRKLEGWEHSNDQKISEIVNGFDQSVKLTIKSDLESVSVRVASRRHNNPKYNISSGLVELSGNEATSLFDDSVDAIMEAFEKQQKLAKMPITTALLVGGLSESNWLWSRLQLYFSARNVRIHRPDNHGYGAVAHGAVLCHMARGNPLIASPIGRSAFDVIKHAIQNMKLGESDLLEKAALNALESLRVCGEGLGSWITYLASENESLREVQRVHEQRHHCEVLFAEGRIHDVVESLIEIVNSTREAVRAGKVVNHWLSDFQRRCRKELEARGDSAMDHKNYTEAAKHFSMILSLDPVDRMGILIKRSNARALMESWDEALSDADEVISLSPSSHRGHEMKYAALHGAGRHAEAVEAFDVMLSKLEGSPYVDTHDLRIQYVDARPTIRHIVEVTIRHMPLVLIDTTTGRLYNKQRQAEIFETLPVYSELVLSMTRRLDPARIRGAVQEFYRYVMLSHKWEDGEPLLQQVKNISIYGLKESSANIKLQKFCSLAGKLGFQWAWSDTCCIDKETNAVLQESLVAMFMWYRNSSLAIVYLRNVLSAGGLRGSIWNTRGWTYQEYVAARIIRFYTEDWEPYLGLTLSNHKESHAIISEMQQATGVSEKEMTILEPGLDRVREKLYLASRRHTARIEDAAYSLFGIFNVALPVMYGEGERAVGRLLEHLLTGSGDVSVLAWTGTSGSYNSCLPKDLTVYDPLVPPHIPQPIEKAKMDSIMELQSSLLDPDIVMMLYKRLGELPSPSLVAHRLTLPGITSSITELVQTSESYSETGLHWYMYRAMTTMFGEIEIKTTEDLTGMPVEDLCVAHPWIRSLLDQEHLPRGAAALRLNKTMRALRLVARLRQPFGALLFKSVTRVEYKRVAADSLIMAQIGHEVLFRLGSLMDAICTIEIH